jgi:hypothetical protein
LWPVETVVDSRRSAQDVHPIRIVAWCVATPGQTAKAAHRIGNPPVIYSVCTSSAEVH